MVLEKMKGRMYDPPSGWRYGFPKPYNPLPGESLADTLRRDGYPQAEIDNGGDEYVRFFGEDKITTQDGLQKLAEKREKEKYKRIWKNYHWTKEQYLALGAKQEWKCAGCGREAQTMPLNIDHEHFKVIAERLPDRTWMTTVTLKDGRKFLGTGAKKADAIAAVKELALPASVRGLLCAGRYAGCNRKFGSIDNAPWLRRMLAYMENPPASGIV